MNELLDQYYGYFPTAKTPEQLDALEPTQPGKDEICFVHHWNLVGDLFKTYIGIGCAIRRPIDVNSDQPKGREPWELVPPDGKILAGCFEYTENGTIWIKQVVAENQDMRTYLSRFPKVIGVRRRKRVAEAAPQFLKDRMDAIAAMPKPTPEEVNAQMQASAAAQSPTPAELDEVAQALYGCMFDGCISEVHRKACCRHLAKVKELQASHDHTLSGYEERVAELEAQLPRWHRVSANDLPGKGEPFDLLSSDDVNGGWMVESYTEGSATPPAETIAENPSAKYWHPLSPIPKQESEAERLVQAYYDHKTGTILPGKVKDDALKEFAEFILARKDKQ